MAFTRKRSWKDWFQEAFLRQGMFSMRPMPTTRAEMDAAQKQGPQDKEITRLNLDSESRGGN